MATILALETATEACSVALLHGDTLLERFEVAPRRHLALLLPFADQLLAEAGCARSEIDAIAFGCGPGAFTGVRFAVASAQGLGMALERPLIAVSTLAALAQPVLDQGVAAVTALLDARMNEIYAGSFAADAEGLALALDEECLLSPEELREVPDAVSTVAGSGVAAYAGRIAVVESQRVAVWDDPAWPRAAAVARLGRRDMATGKGVAAELAEPVYLRHQVALTLAQRQSVVKSATNGSCQV